MNDDVTHSCAATPIPTPLRTRNPDEFLPTRKSLLTRLKDWEDHEGWKEFFDTYWRLIYQTGLKAGLSDPEAQDVVQETIISVSKKMPDFKYNPALGSFKSWLLQLTRWRIADHLRKRQSAGRYLLSHCNRPDSDTRSTDDIPDPHSSEFDRIWDAEWEHTLIEAALECIKRRVEPKQYQLFDLYVIKQWPVTKVAAALKVNAGRVYLAKHRISALLKKEILRLRTRWD